MSRQDSDVLEEGDIFFAYRPSVSAEEVGGVEDLQRFYLVLVPRGSRDRARLIVIGRKRLADIQRHERYWGFVDEVTSPRRIEEDLRAKGGKENPSQPTARTVGEGVYVVARHGNHTHLAYALELPCEPGEPQQELNIAPEASFVLSVKNPEAASPKGVGLSPERKAEFPKHLQERFGGRRFISADPPDFLDYAGTELLFVGAREDPEEELDVDLDAETCPAEGRADVLNLLHMAKSRHPAEPLFKGEWR